jgi:cytoskeleton protein RodZ
LDLGNDLRQARELAGVSLSDLAARTRIPLTSLRAIEQHEFSKVPPGIFVRSFIRTYAREVGVDPAAAIAEFRAMTEPAEEPAAKLQDAAPVDDGIRSRLILDLAGARHHWGSALIVGALVIGIVILNRNAPLESAATVSAPPVSAPPVSALPVSAPPVSATAPLPEVPLPVAVATTGTGLQMELRTQGPCWIRAVVDGQVSFARLLQPGEVQSLTADRDIVLRIGDPAALAYSINGQAGQPLGAANIPVTVRFGTDGAVSPVS